MTRKTPDLIPVIFDMDGVLVDSEPLHQEVERKIFEELGLNIPEEQHFSFIGMAPLKVWSIIRDRYGLEENATTLKAREQGRKYHLFRRREIPLIDGVEELLKILHAKGHSLALASSSPRRIIDLFTTKTNTKSYFEFLLCGEEVPNGKPEPDIFLEAARRLETSPSDCVVIEDSANGVRAAKAAGMRCIGFQNPHSGMQDLVMADLIVDHLEREREKILQFIHGHSSS
jgi:HAD superfamily hydrolase (TIGR01509 family)